MTELKKPLQRRLNVKMGKRPLIIQIEPETPEHPGHIRLKEKGAHKWYDLSIQEAYILAIEKNKRKGK